MKPKVMRWLGILVICVVVGAFCLVFRPIQLKPFTFVEPSLKHIQLGLDLKGGTRLTLRAIDMPKDKSKLEVMTRVKDIISRRVDAFGLGEVPLYLEGEDRVVVEMPGVAPKKAQKMLGETARLEFKKIPLKYDAEVEEIDGRERVVYIHKRTKKPVPEEVVYKESELIMTGEEFKNADVGQDRDRRPAVLFSLQKEGAKRFREFTRRNINRICAIFLDGKTISAPRVKDVIPGGEGIISGGFKDYKEAADLKKLLNAGALPVTLKVVEIREVSPTLGKDSVDKSLKAGILGFCLVVLFMIGYYRLPGLLADFALLIYILLVLGALVAFRATITLPGIAAFILSIGMAVDANVIIFERTKEEIRSGKTILSAVPAGFERAWPAIRDCNITSIIAAVCLYFWGTGPIKGFAITLGLGVILSMFTAITVTRLFLTLVLQAGVGQDLRYYRT